MSRFCLRGWQDPERSRRTHVTEVREERLGERVLKCIDVSVSEKVKESQLSTIPVQLDSDSLDFLVDREGRQDLP